MLLRISRLAMLVTLVMSALLVLEGCGSSHRATSMPPGGRMMDQGMMGHGMMERGMMDQGMMGRGMTGRGMTDGGSTGQSAAKTAPAPLREGAVRVDLQQMRFSPARLRVKAGTTVVFTNRDPYPHRVLQSTVEDLGKAQPAFISPELQQGQSWAYTFNQPGTYAVLCDVGGHHLAGMVGGIEVTQA